MKLKKYLQEWNENWPEDLENFVTGYKEKLDVDDDDIDPWEDTEFKTEKYLNAAEKIVDTIGNECWPFIKEITNTKRFLYRGVEREVHGIRKLKSHLKDRSPESSDVESHDIFNKLATKKFGWPIRNGVACTGNRALAGNFGYSTCLFFPIGKYEYAWSPIYKDLVLHYTYHMSDEQIFKKYTKMLKTYTNKNLQTAIKKKGEIMFKCNYYYIVEEMYETALSLAIFGE